RPSAAPSQTVAARPPAGTPASHPAASQTAASTRIPKSLPLLTRMPEIGEHEPITAASLHAKERIEEQNPSHAWSRSPARPARYLFLSNQPTPLNLAREALNKGENAKASQLYERVLRQEPGNPSALAGLAALAMREQREDRARHLYQELARLQPDSPIALAGLNALDRSSAPETLESRLRALPAGSPDIPPLQFVLGTRLAARDRWPAARDAFQAALRFDADNPDLHHNLAVALEHTGARQEALTHYREALRARAHRGWAGFDPNRIQRRIFTLQTSFPDA
ncbi:MAG: tetratricopeptide repeat protein, partial [Magnetococcales bacterium]|nr:tetratricopeptide repeat protein [Magnetococcales bacterium]